MPMNNATPTERRGLPARAQRLTLALMLLFYAGCDRNAPTPASVIIPPTAAFDAANAFREVEAFVALGAKVSGTEGARRAAEHIQARLIALHVPAELQAFEDATPTGPLPFQNVIATLSGSDARTILVGCHYDTKSGIDPFVGANDSGSGVGLLLELARLLRSQPPVAGPTIMLAFFDGEECRLHYGPNDGLHGSRALARQLTALGQTLDAVIIVDMIGDADLNIMIPRNCDPALTALAFQAASAEGVRQQFALAPGDIIDDHVPFQEMGIPTLNLIDFTYGSAPGLNDYWHTPEDTLDKLSPESLGITGRVLLRILATLAATPAKP